MEESASATATTSRSTAERPLELSLYEESTYSAASTNFRDRSERQDMVIGGLSPNATGQNRLTVRNIRNLHTDQEPLLQHLRKYRATEYMASHNNHISSTSRSGEWSPDRETPPWKPAGSSRAPPRKAKSSSGRDDESTSSNTSSRRPCTASQKNKPLSLEEQIRQVEIEIRRVNGQKVWRMAPMSSRGTGRR